MICFDKHNFFTPSPEGQDIWGDWSNRVFYTGFPRWLGGVVTPGKEFCIKINVMTTI